MEKEIQEQIIDVIAKCDQGLFRAPPCFAALSILVSTTAQSRRPEISINYDEGSNTAEVTVIGSVKTSDKKLEWVAKKSFQIVRNFIECDSGKMQATWLNNGISRTSEDDPNTKYLKLKFECVK